MGFALSLALSRTLSMSPALSLPLERKVGLGGALVLCIKPTLSPPIRVLVPHTWCDKGKLQLSSLPRGGEAPSSRYRGTSLVGKRLLAGPYRRAVPRALWWSWGVRVFW